MLSAKSGANGDEAAKLALGSDKGMRRFKEARAAPLRIGVPLGTVVRKKRSRHVIAELTQPFQQAVVLQGGHGGLGVSKPSRNRQVSPRRKSEGVIPIKVDENWKAAAKGGSGEEATLELLLRIVADVGIIGLPSAGKSSLLAAITRAKPEVADYPFTTLIPNLGTIQTSPENSLENMLGMDLENMDDESLAQLTLDDFEAPTALEKSKLFKKQSWDDDDYERFDDKTSDPGAPVIADLPGLIEGAHKGRGLGRNFLRHLARTKVLLHCIDVGSDPTAVAGSQGIGALDDYYGIRDEVRMYNPRYLQRPYVVVLTKMDLPGAEERADAFEAALQDAPVVRESTGMTAEMQKWAEEFPPLPPAAVVRASAVDGTGVDELSKLLEKLSAESRSTERESDPSWRDMVTDGDLGESKEEDVSPSQIESAGTEVAVSESAESGKALATDFSVLQGTCFRKVTVEDTRVVRSKRAVGSIVHTTGRKRTGPQGGEWVELDSSREKKAGWMAIHGANFGIDECLLEPLSRKGSKKENQTS
eukprot:gnl/MRDRNA2_/MRDRNA2_34555_c0_seq1.p1 gnl/MRDRNA2_/MRDRNA2_34555_c0~~gnl/MRDRNA2_/MRDRNA2_34555_c0_seq1.p1  ORF type:complete len:532 (-),score=125.94 gnl/MRDRNA2_/MRDRNA2_34555_c0_seq1:6-1601(-)